MSKTVKIRQDLTDPPDQVKNPPLLTEEPKKGGGFFSRNTPDSRGKLFVGIQEESYLWAFERKVFCWHLDHDTGRYQEIAQT